MHAVLTKGVFSERLAIMTAALQKYVMLHRAMAYYQIQCEAADKHVTGT